MKPIITIESIRAQKPCYDPSRHLPADYSASLASFLTSQTQVPPEDRIWVAVRLVNDRDARLFACWCARKALAATGSPDPRSVAAVDTAEQFARGNATAEELTTAESAARSARYAAESAASSAALSAAWSAASSAARYAARQEQCEWLAGYLTDVYGE